MTMFTIGRAALAVAALLACGTARAGDGLGAPLSGEADAAETGTGLGPAAGAAQPPMSAADLAAQSGTHGAPLGTGPALTADNRDNTVTGATVVTGTVSIGGGALQGFAGVGNILMNSGNNSNIQGNISINVIAPGL